MKKVLLSIAILIGLYCTYFFLILLFPMFSAFLRDCKYIDENQTKLNRSDIVKILEPYIHNDSYETKVGESSSSPAYFLRNEKNEVVWATTSDGVYIYKKEDALPTRGCEIFIENSRVVQVHRIYND